MSWWGPLLGLAVACGPTLEPELGGGAVRVSALDGRPLDGVSPAPRLVLELRDPSRAAELFEGVHLFEGELSSYADEHLRDGELTTSLTEREVQLSVWSEGSAILVQPARFLDAGTHYALAALGFGELASLTVSAEPVRQLHQVWPTAVVPGGSVIYCANEGSSEGARGAPKGSVTLAPHAASASVLLGVGQDAVEADRCVTVVMPEELDGEFVLAPSAFERSASTSALASMTGTPLFDPRPIAVVRREAPSPTNAECATSLGPACASFVGTQLLLEGAPPGAWALLASEEGTQADVESFSVFPAGSRAAFHGFGPGATYALSATYFDGLGRTQQGAAQLATGAPAARLVVSEVLANPLGAEPASEWVEIVNVGLGTATLDGVFLEDSGGSVALPDVELAPGQFGLVVASDYSALGADVVPDGAAAPVVVPRVGKGGLTNSGERVSLVSATGEVLSSVPALAASRQGVSWARRDLWAPDVPESFAEHAAPGASPGTDNVFAE